MQTVCVQKPKRNKTKHKNKSDDEGEQSEESYQPTHILAEDIDGGGFKVDPSPTFYGGQLKALLGKIPKNISIYDIYFDIEVNDWIRWDTISSVTLKDPSGAERRLYE